MSKTENQGEPVATYHILIERTQMVETVTRKQWAKIGTDENGKDIMGYTPQEPERREETVKILEQNVENFNLNSVIKAINLMPK